MLQNIRNKFKTLGNAKKCFLLLSTVLLLTLGVGSTAAYVVTGTPPLFNRFLNGMNPDGNLVIQKIVEHPFGDGYVILENLSFTFEVNLGAKYANETLKTTQGEQTADENGVLTVSAVPGGRTTVYDIDDGTSVTVTETDIGAGFTPDTAAKEVTIEKYKNNEVTFTNNYVPEKAEASILSVSGEKSLAGRDWQEGDSFTFALEVYKEGDWTEIGTDTVTYALEEKTDPENEGSTILVPKADFDQFDFTDVIRGYTFADTGTYSFRVIEKEGTIGGITYDKAESFFDVTVGDADMNGALEIQSVTTESENTKISTEGEEGKLNKAEVKISFVNQYAPEGSTEAFMNIQKIVEDISGQGKSPAGFTFELYDEEENKLQTSEPTNEAGETSIRLVYEPTDAGKTFNYILKETNAGETIAGMTYDEAEHHIQIDVVDNLDGTVSAYIYGDQGLQVINETEEIVKTDETVKSEEPVKTEEAETSTEPETIEGSTSLEENEDSENSDGNTETEAEVNSEASEESKDNANSEETKEIEENADSEETTENTEETGKSGAAAESEALEETLDLVPAAEPSDPVEIDVVFVSEPAGDVDTAEPENTYDVTFTNTYDPEDASVMLGGTKTLEGRTLRDREFTFHLYQTEERFEIAEGAQPLSAAVNAADGTFVFDALTFDKVGTYDYVVTEDDTNKVGGVTYDPTRYLLKVVVTDTEGVLNTEVSMTDAYGVEAEQIVFKNTYRAAKVSLPLGGKKILNGAELKADAFDFQIAVANEAFEAAAEPFQTVKNTGEGSFAFNDLEFASAGTYRYVVTEDDSAKVEGMTYDDTVYGITVEVTDPGDGQLVVSDVSMTADGEAVTEIVFENTYKAPVTPEEPDEPEEPDNSEKPEDKEEETPEDSGETPEVSKDPAATGDNSSMMLYAVLMIFALGVAIFGRKKWQK